MEHRGWAQLHAALPLGGTSPDPRWMQAPHMRFSLSLGLHPQVGDYRAINLELELFNPEIRDKPQVRTSQPGAGTLQSWV